MRSNRAIHTCLADLDTGAPAKSRVAVCARVRQIPQCRSSQTTPEIPTSSRASPNPAPRPTPNPTAAQSSPSRARANARTDTAPALCDSTARAHLVPVARARHWLALVRDRSPPAADAPMTSRPDRAVHHVLERARNSVRCRRVHAVLQVVAAAAFWSTSRLYTSSRISPADLHLIPHRDAPLARAESRVRARTAQPEKLLQHEPRAEVPLVLSHADPGGSAKALSRPDSPPGTGPIKFSGAPSPPPVARSDNSTPNLVLGVMET
jgi:hypothetical protein